MKKQFEFLKDYLFLRCFSTEEYMDSFLSGKCLYMNSAQKFWHIENGFQGDPSECCVISPNDKVQCSWWVGSGKPKEKLCDINHFRFSIQGFLYCMFTIPKNFFKAENGELFYDRDNTIHQDFITTLNQYRANTNTGCSFICIFDAFQFMNRIGKYFELHGIDFACGWISYKNEDLLTKMQHIKEKQFEKIVFTKPEEYKYQREFRIFVSNGAQENDALKLAGISIEDIIFLRATMIQDWRD